MSAPTLVSSASLAVPSAPPLVPSLGLSTLWFQVTGFSCNLACTHCLVSASPTNRALRFLEVEEIVRRLGEAEELGVKEIYFTGGEPFLHPHLVEILARSLAVAPTTVLTNGIPIRERTADALARIAQGARYSLEIRVSLDSPDESANDAVRGRGAFAGALRAIRLLDERGLAPILTATEICLEGSGVYARFRDLLVACGVRRPRVKILPLFAVGRMEDAGTGADGLLTRAQLADFDVSVLQCTEGRVVAADGIYLCPILVGKAEARVAARSLADATGPVPLAHAACTTCYARGASCKNY